MAKQVNCTVSGKPTDTPTLVVDNGHSYPGVFESATRVIFTVDGHDTGGFGINAGGKYIRTDACVLPLDVNMAMEGPVIAYPPALRPLHPQDMYLVDDNGVPVVLGLSTDFRLFEMYLRGVDISGVIRQRIDADAQGFRVFGTCCNLFDLDPRDHDGYYQSLRDFAQILATMGLYLHFTAITDCQSMDKGFDAHAHWTACCDALADEPNIAVMELVNEWFKNGVDPRQFIRPTRAPANISVGSFVDGMFVPAKWGTIQTFHPTRNDKWDVTVPQTVYELRNTPGVGQLCPVWIGEPIGAAAAPRGDRSTDAAKFERLGVACGVFAAGGVFHSDAGLQSALWSSTEEACARAFFKGIHR